MTIPSYTEHRWTPCVYTRRRLIPPSENAIHKNNKALRLKSTKCWDSLNKSYCWQRAGTVCVNVCVCVRARECVSGVCWTHFRSERKCWQGEFVFLSEMYTLHHSRSKAHVPSVSVRSEPKRSFPCVRLLVCDRGSVCISTYWVIYWEDRGLAEKDKSEERRSGIMCLRGFSLSYPLWFLDDKLKQCYFPLSLPSSSPRSQLNQAAIQEYWDEAPQC